MNPYKALTIVLGTAISLVATTAHPQLIANGGFEQPVTPGIGAIYYAGGTVLPGWTVTSASVDIHNATYFAPHSGYQSLDLDGTSAGEIQQSFATQIGLSYTLTFAYSNNGWGGTSPASARMIVLDQGNSVLLSQIVTHGGATPTAMNYQLFSGVFTADSLTTTLRFTSLDAVGSVGGVVLDDIAVIAVPEPSVPALAVMGTIAALLAGLFRSGRHALGR